ncbi:MAG: pyruvate, phosphate dikinase [Ardenticatenaceae bacterium]|nr:pyruvate, phosphate dikinase [Ardenticatenaceae bacterium]
MEPPKWVYLFHEVDEAEEYAGDWDGVRALLGGKGANLAEMTRLGLPVPPGFTVTTEACIVFLKAGEQFPPDLWEQVLVALKEIERKAGKGFGDSHNPLLVSCRSGAKFSMPGMMDTVLNIGLTEETARGMIELTGDSRFVYDAYRRLVQMFGSVVMGIPDEPLEEILTGYRRRRGVETDAELAAEDWIAVTAEFKALFQAHTGRPFPDDPYEQLRLAIEAVFKSWNGKRAVDYRNAAGISHDLGTAVNIQTMVFGNMGWNSATGVATTRNISTGENEIEGDYLLNAQGEDVVAGIRLTKDISELKNDLPRAWDEFATICRTLEKHYREVQDVEFTVERGKLWMLQTRDSKRTAQAAVRIAADLAEEGLITREEAVWRITPAQIDFFLHPQFDSKAKKAAAEAGDLLATGLNVSPGAAVGMIAFDADTAEAWARKEGRDVIMVRPETKPDDVHGMLAARGILTSRGGRTSHAALVARQFGKPAVVGVAELEIDLTRREMAVNGRVFKEGGWISIEGTSGEVYAGKLETTIPDINDPHLLKMLSWADEIRTLQVWANADYPRDAQRARDYGAQGIGLTRTEHMFFETERLPFVQQMILADNSDERNAALEALLPFQRSDFEGLFRVMDGLPVIIRLIDPPLHEFLPSHDELLRIVTELQTRKQLGALTSAEEQTLAEKEDMLAAVNRLREANPMLGLRGVRLGIHIPELTAMQVRAIFEAACTVAKEGVEVHPEVMIPLTAHVNELKVERADLERVARQVVEEQGIEIPYKFGTMIEIPRAALTADEIAGYAEFFSFGTNDLTQTTFGISRDDAEAGFLVEYQEKHILPENPFATIDERGVGKLMEMAVKLGRQTRPDLEVGICGEHGGDPNSVHFCHRIGLNYVSCSPFRIPIARLAAAHAALGRSGRDL